MSKWLYLWQVLRKGYRLSNAGTWKNRQLVSTAIVGFLVALYAFASGMGWVPDGYNNEVTEFGSSLGVLLWTFFSSWATVATTTKIGLADPDDDGDELRELPRQIRPKPVPPYVDRPKSDNPFLE